MSLVVGDNLDTSTTLYTDTRVAENAIASPKGGFSQLEKIAYVVPKSVEKMSATFTCAV
jgi:hypothetical protein